MVNLCFPGEEISYQGFFTVLVVFCSDSIHPKLDLLPLSADLSDPLPQFNLLPLCFADAFLQRKQGIKSNGL